MNHSITAIQGIRVGHSEDIAASTGSTVVLFDNQFVVSVDARGGWPGTLDTDSVGPAKTFFRKHAIFLTGGDVFGFQCVGGIQRYLIEDGLASKQGPGNLPGIVGANIYDLEFSKRPGQADYSFLGYQACKNATNEQVKEGNFGAGLGATLGKLKGIRFATKGGVGSSVVDYPAEGIQIGAIFVCNAVGNVFDGSGRTIAGTRRNEGPGYVEFEELAQEYVGKKEGFASSRATTIGVVATNLDLSHEQALKVAEMAHDGLARCIRPVHTTTDGDTIFCVSTGEVKRKVSLNLLDIIGHSASVQTTKAVLSAARNAEALNGIPAMLKKEKSN